MIVRTITPAGDWTFGKGIQNYSSANNAVAQSIQTKLQFFLNDCFFAANVGIDWFNLLGGKNQALLNLQISMTIQNAPGVLNVVQTSYTFTSVARSVNIQYLVNTIFTGSNVVLAGEPSFLLTESGEFLSTEGGGRIIL